MATIAVTVTNPSQTVGSGEVLVGAGEINVVFPSGLDSTKIDKNKFYNALLTLGQVIATPGFIVSSADSVVLTFTQDVTRR